MDALGRMRVIVQDEWNAAVPFALLHLKNVGSGSISNAIAGRDGSFEFQSLSRGDYQIEAMSPGFLSATVEETFLPNLCDTLIVVIVLTIDPAVSVVDASESRAVSAMA